VTPLFRPNFVYEIREAFCMGKVHHGTRFRAMAITAANYDLVPAGGKIQYRLVFFPTAQP